MTTTPVHRRGAGARKRPARGKDAARVSGTARGRGSAASGASARTVSAGTASARTASAGTVSASRKEASRSGALSPAARRAFGALLPLIDEPGLRDVLVQVRGGAGRLWADSGGRLREIRGWRAAPDTVRRLATDLIAAGGRHLDELHPCTDVRLGAGIRVHAVLPPVAVEGAAVSIRLPGVSPPDFEELVRAGLCAPGEAEWLRRAVAAHRNLLITGGTGSGKTTLLSALLDLVPSHERILMIEDVAELRPRHGHVLSLEARQANSEGAGEVSLDRLLREALRMRPDRIVLGECRGAEVSTLLTALNTGHDGGAGTLHASRLEDVPARLEALGALAGLSSDALARQAAPALHGIVHLEHGGGRHRVSAIGRLVLRGAGVLGAEPVRV